MAIIHCSYKRTCKSPPEFLATTGSRGRTGFVRRAFCETNSAFSHKANSLHRLLLIASLDPEVHLVKQIEWELVSHEEHVDVISRVNRLAVGKDARAVNLKRYFKGKLRKIAVYGPDQITSKSSMGKHALWSTEHGLRAVDNR